MSASGPAPSAPDENLSDAEQQMLTAALSGTLVDLQTGNASDDDPAQGKSWDASRRIRASLLAAVLTGIWFGGKTPRAVKLRGARITGPLDLEASTIACPLLLRDCYLDESVSLDEATAPSIRMPGCNLPTLTAAQLRTTGDLELSGTKFITDGGISLLGARIGGQLGMAGVSLANPGGTALTADNLTVEQGMFCDDAFTANGEISLAGAHVGGQLSLSGARLTNTGGPALTADGLTVDGNMFCKKEFTANGEIRLLGACIGGQLDMSGARLTNTGGPALTADGLTVDRSMLCRDGFTANGEIRLLGACIGGQLDMSGAKLASPGGQALNAEHISVGDNMFCTDQITANGEIRLLFCADGEMRLLSARIGGQLILNGARLTNTGGKALHADGLTVGQSMFCADEFTAAGEVRLNGAHIGGQLDMSRASLASNDGSALCAQRFTVDRDMLCLDGFTATGEINLLGAHIGGQLDLSGASLTNPGGCALILEGADAAELRLQPRQPPDGEVSLTDAKVGNYHDDPASWPTVPVLHLDGFAYSTLSREGITTRRRLQWLTLHRDGYVPQLYDQLASTYRRAGDEQAARKVAIAKQRRGRRAFSPLSWLWYLTVGYGYRPWLAGAWLIALAALGTAVFRSAYPAHMIATSPHPPPFHAAAYAVDLVLPVIGLGQKSAWHPQGSAYEYWSWAFTAAGWVLATAFVAGLTGILRRGQPTPP